MTLVRWDPLRNVSTLQERINRLFNDAFPSTTYPEDDISMSTWRPSVDIYDTEHSIVINVELPGINKESISVDVKGNFLTLRGERTDDREIIEERYYRRERSFGTFHRVFTLPSEIDPDKIKARFKDGVLEIEIPRPEAENPKKITVNVE